MTEPEAAPAGDAVPPAEPLAGEPGPPSPRPSLRRRALVALLAWLLPGAGHLLLRQWFRGAVFLLLVVGGAAVGARLEGRLYWFGEGLAAPAAEELPGEVQSAWLVLAGSLVSVGLGAVAGVLRWGLGYQGSITAPGYEYGSAFLLTAGLMNLLLVLDAWDGAGAPRAAPEGPP